MGFRTALLATALATTFGLGATAQTTTPTPQQRPDGQQANPSPMPPGSRAGDAPGMGSTGAAAAQGATTGQANPTPMPPGSQAGTAPGMNPTGMTSQGRAGAMPPGAQAPTGTAQTGSAQSGGAQVAPPGAPAGSPQTLGQGQGTSGQTMQGTGRTTAQGATNPDRGVPGGMGAQAPSGQPDVGRGTAPGMSPRTGATTPNSGTTGGGATNDSTPRSGAAPVPGANSFTEGQARSRIADVGFTDVQGLRKDDQGIWRGTAMRNGQRTGVALDYQGNVVAVQ